MLVFRKYRPEDFQDVSDFLVENNILKPLDDWLVYLGIEDNKIFAMAMASYSQTRWYLEDVFVKANQRGSKFGDALLRTMFLNIEKLGDGNIYRLERHPYLDKLGFEKNEGDYYLDIGKFFGSGCCSCGTCNSI